MNVTAGDDETLFAYYNSMEFYSYPPATTTAVIRSCIRLNNGPNCTHTSVCCVQVHGDVLFVVVKLRV